MGFEVHHIVAALSNFSQFGQKIWRVIRLYMALQARSVRQKLTHAFTWQICQEYPSEGGPADWQFVAQFAISSCALLMNFRVLGKARTSWTWSAMRFFNSGLHECEPLDPIKYENPFAFEHGKIGGEPSFRRQAVESRLADHAKTHFSESSSPENQSFESDSIFAARFVAYQIALSFQAAEDVATGAASYFELTADLEIR